MTGTEDSSKGVINLGTHHLMRCGELETHATLTHIFVDHAISVGFLSRKYPLTSYGARLQLRELQMFREVL